MLKGDTEVVCMSVYGHVGLGLKGATFGLLRIIAAATDGGRRFVIAFGDLNINVDDLEALGMLDALGLSVARPANCDVASTMGKGSLIDYALVTTRFAAAIDSFEAVKTAPWDRIAEYVQKSEPTPRANWSLKWSDR